MKPKELEDAEAAAAAAQVRRSRCVFGVCRAGMWQGLQPSYMLAQWLLNK